MKPVTRAMTAVFGHDSSGVGFEDDDLSSDIQDKFLDVLKGMKSFYKNGNPRFTDRHCRVLLLRFGFEDGQTYSLREIGQKMNMSGTRAGQILHKTLRMLRHPSRSRILRESIVKKE